MAYQTINLANLAAPSAVALWSFDSIKAATTADVVARLNAGGIAYNVESLTGNPVHFVIDAYAYREGLMLQRINDAVNSTFLATAIQDADIDLRAADVNKVRVAGESNASLKQRAQLAWEALSTGGTDLRYKSNALDADPVGLADVAVYGAEVSPIPPGQVWIICLGANSSGLPSPATLAAVLAACSPRAARPVNDQVFVKAVRPDNYSIDATLILAAGADAAAVTAGQLTALNAFAAARQKIGAQVTPNNIAAVLGYNGAGLVKDVVVRSPSATIGGDPFAAPVLTGARLVSQVSA